MALRRILVGFIACLFIAGCTEKVVEAGILNEWENLDKAIASSDPKTSVLYDFVGGQTLQGTSADILAINKDELGIGSLRLGFVFSEDLPYLELEAKVPNIIKAYVPELIPGNKISLGSVDLLPSVGAFVGYRSKDEGDVDKIAAGLSIGFKVQF